MTPKAYYNEIDPYAVKWLEALISAGAIAPGDVDDRPIQEITANDVKNYTQCHFFAGIAGWSYALRLAGWPDDRPVWTGSCPCQPFSGAGRKQGASDKRHLWPAFFSLIAECIPPTIFGEQVAGKLGLEWLAAVRLDLESLGYACGAADLPAACVGAPHIRQRLFWGGYHQEQQQRKQAVKRLRKKHRRATRNLDDPESERWEVGDAENERPPAGKINPPADPSAAGLENRDAAVADGYRKALARQSGILLCAEIQQKKEFSDLSSDSCPDDPWVRAVGNAPFFFLCPFPPTIREEAHFSAASPWDGAEFVRCADGKARPVKPGILPLAHGLSHRVGKIGAYGNAIVPQVAAEFVRAYEEALVMIQDEEKV